VGIGDLLMQMVEAASAKFVVIVDETKVCAFQSPSEILGWKTTCIRMEELWMKLYACAFGCRGF
jgi:hypothetical protein